MASDDEQPARRRTVAAWVLFDWAYGAFATVVATFVFPAYFTQKVAGDPATGTSQWAGAQAAAGILIALLSVPLGVVADRGGRRPPILATAAGLMTAATFGLWFVRPQRSDVGLALGLVMVATFSFEIATVFYNAILPGLVSPRRLGRLSMLAWGAGYAGGLTCLGLCLALLIFPADPPFGLDRAQAEPVRACALVAGCWLAAFGWPVLVFVPESRVRQNWRVVLREGVAELRATLRAVIADRSLGRFLVARLFYMDGLTTLFAFGGIYAAGQFGLDAKQVLVFGIGLNVTAGIGAAAFAVLEDRIGSKATVMVSLIALTTLGLGVLLVRDRVWFWALSLALGLFVGPAQAASRSMMARMAPAHARSAYFGLFAVSGRVTGFLGPLALSLVTAAFHSQRAGMVVIVVLLALGAVLLSLVRSPPPQP